IRDDDDAGAPAQRGLELDARGRVGADGARVDDRHPRLGPREARREQRRYRNSKSLPMAHTSRARSPSNRTPTPARARHRTTASVSMGVADAGMRNEIFRRSPAAKRSTTSKYMPPRERLRERPLPVTAPLAYATSTSMS